MPASVDPLSPPMPESAGVTRWSGLSGSEAALAISRLAEQQVVMVIAPDPYGVTALRDEISAYAAGGPAPVRSLPDWETLPYDVFAPHPELVSRRIATLFSLRDWRRGVVVASAATALQRMAPRAFVRGHGLMVELGDRIDLEAMSAKLIDRGYRRVPQVLDPGDFAVRGALLDLFPSGAEAPLRIELFDEQVESIRTFDPETQRSVEKVDQVRLLPAREFPTDERGLDEFRRRFRQRFDVNLTHCGVYQDARQGTLPAGIEYYLPLFFDDTDIVFDYLPDDAMVVLADGVEGAMTTFHKQTDARYEQRRHDVTRPILSPDELYLEQADFQAELAERPVVQLPPASEVADVAPAGDNVARRFEALRRPRTLVVAPTPGHRETLLDRLKVPRPEIVSTETIRAFLAGDAPLAITVAPLRQGARVGADTIVLTETELTGEAVATRRRAAARARDPAAIIRDLGSLAEGAPVVHEEHGVGRYRGLQTLAVGAGPTEFLVLEYADADKLYVPVASLHLISRYTGAAPEQAPLHRLGSDQWEKARKRAAKRAHDVAAELLELYARREARDGTAMTVEDAAYQRFAAGFPFETTDDQQRAIDEVIADLASARSMDRVVCGDVGFGKTEVALRAAFVAAMAGYQTAVLVPTTLLARQHYENFSDRFADWPLRVEVLSRFRTAGDAKGVRDELAQGKVDIVIGTHRLLQKEVRFHRLGLVIIDEEQRFGVRQKERLKKLRAEVDVLTLTATPIPRTLNMALSGLRDLSIIATAPENRLAVQTLITQWDAGVIREALQRELQRGGQVFFLHNEVQSIGRIADDVRRIVPEAKVEIAHGQMHERELESVMVDFYRQRFNVLVCTTIVENGIDIPSANTIVMNRADRLGLAQIHQLRGRVGRSHHRAFAYLVIPPAKAMTADARKRLDAIASLEELGAGFTLATHDMEIRGAGELLGDDQSGQIEAVGFAMYSDLLERAIRSLQDGDIPDQDLTVSQGVEVELHEPALIPEAYLDDVHARLTLYKRIAGAKDRGQLRELQVEMIDRFGLLPSPVKTLFAAAELRLRCAQLGIRRLELGGHGARVDFARNTRVEPLQLIKLVQERPDAYRLEGDDRLRYRRELPDLSQRLAAAESILDSLEVRRAA